MAERNEHTDRHGRPPSEEEGPAHKHRPVMLDRVVELIEPATHGRDQSVVVDATVGMGGHAEAVLERCANARLLGLDRDHAALDQAGQRLARFGERFKAIHAVYDRIPDVMAGEGLTRVQGIVFDLGVSSLQLDERERGFAYAQDAPLDMRMDQHTTHVTAADVLNTYDEADLVRILRRYGEERFAHRIARAIVRERATEPFTTSARLVELLRAVIPAPARRTGGHPAKRTFQALRIEVNGELRALERALPAAVDAIAVGGRIVVLSYHSLEDRLVKQAFAAGARSTAPPDLPVELPEHQPVLKLLGRSETPSADEVESNPRAASARLRAVERIREAA